MFERSLVESRGLAVSNTQGWTALGSLTLQTMLVAVLIALPLMRPEALRIASTVPEVVLPRLSKPPVVQIDRQSTGTTRAWLPASSSMPVIGPRGSSIAFPSYPKTGLDMPQMVGVGPMTGGVDALHALSTAGLTRSPGPAVVRARPTTPMRISSGVGAGMLLTPIQPVYPPIAKAAGVQGAVVLDAVISKAGQIESLHVVSGPEMLRKSALDAVARARYRPCLLNGEAVDVQTTITVIFQMAR